jgi:hypothetical protein
MPKSPRARCVDAATELIDSFIAIIVGHEPAKPDPAKPEIMQRDADAARAETIGAAS